MPDRPAAEPLADPDTRDPVRDAHELTQAADQILDLEGRLARAEQWPGSREGLARLMFDNDYQLHSSDEREHMWKRARQSYYYRHADTIIAALRASQGGQT